VSLGKKVVRSWPAAAIAAAALLAGVYDVNAAWVLLASGLTGFLLRPDVDTPTPNAIPRPGKVRAMPAILLMIKTASPLWSVLTTFLKIGFVFFGGGFVLVPVLHHRLVTELAWLKPQEFLDALAISNLAPGPIALLATFAGYHHAGVIGAVIATVALFAPGVLLMLVISWQYRRLRNDRRVRRFLSGINPSVVGLILSAVPVLGHGAFASWPSYVLLAVSFALLTGLRWHPAFVLAIGAAAGYLGLLP
jgi:chromate transporter